MSKPEDRAAQVHAAGEGLLMQANGGVERPRTWNPDLVGSLQGLLLAGRVNDEVLDRELGMLTEEYGGAVYSELIYLMSHLRFEPDEAKEHWTSIVELRRSMQRRLDSPIDLRVALVSYFLEIHRKLENPTVIEMTLFEQAREMAYRDELTGLHNFRYFKEFLDYEIYRSERCHSSVSLVMIDIDDFKVYNDTLGHPVGNEALGIIAELINRSLRRVDLAARYGGEEFAVVAPETSKVGASYLAERIRERIESHGFPGEEQLPGARLTASLGIATYPADGADVDELVRRADQALYLGKSSGKNQVCLYGNNRRTYPRIKATIEGDLRYGAQEGSLTTLDVSKGGVRFLTDLDLPSGALVDVSLRLSEPAGEITIAGRIVQSAPRAEGGFDASLQTIESSAQDRLRFAAAMEEMTSAPQAGEEGTEAPPE
jgi:diguanylate cyclase (GGDEF)-like protein